MALDPSCEAAYAAVFSDTDSTTWCILGQDGRKVVKKATGTGGLDALTANWKDDEVSYSLLRRDITDDGGDSKRVKFVYLVWVGEGATALKKGKVNEQKPIVGALFKGHHIEKAIYNRSDLPSLEADITAALKKAGGANYDMGNINSGVKAGAAGSIKQQSKEFFTQKDKETEIKGIQFTKFTRTDKSVTSCDLGTRVMTAGATEAKRNTVGYVAPTQPTGKEAVAAPPPAAAAPAAAAAKPAPAPSPAKASPARPAAADQQAAGTPASAKKTGASPAQSPAAGGAEAAPGSSSKKKPQSPAVVGGESPASPKLPASDPRNDLSDTDTGPSYDEAAAEPEEEGDFSAEPDEEPQQQAEEAKAEEAE